MRGKGILKSQAMDSVRLQRLIDVCCTKENTALHLLEEWNYEPQVRSIVLLVSQIWGDYRPEFVSHLVIVSSFMF